MDYVWLDNLWTFKLIYTYKCHIFMHKFKSLKSLNCNIVEVILIDKLVVILNEIFFIICCYEWSVQILTILIFDSSKNPEEAELEDTLNQVVWNLIYYAINETELSLRKLGSIVFEKSSDWISCII